MVVTFLDGIARCNDALMSIYVYPIDDSIFYDITWMNFAKVGSR
jgi:hypothetical protein